MTAPPVAPARRWWSSISAKLSVLVIFLLGAISLFIYLFFPTRQERQAMQAMAAKAQSIAGMTAFTIGPALFFKDAETIEEALASARQNEELVYLEIRDSAQQTLALFDRDQEAPTPRQRLAGGLYETGQPVLYAGRQVGQLRLGLSLHEIAAESRRSRRNIALVSLVIFIIGVGAVLGISAVVTRPLARMAHTVERISQGDLRQRISSASGDEIGLLARAFNRMVDHLEAAYGQLEEANRSLEKRVEERTRELLEEIDERERAEAEKTRLEEQLRQAQKMEAVGQLTAGIAHNFNNMLQIIMSSIEMSRSAVYGDSEQFLREAELSCQRAAAMIEQLMVFSRKLAIAKDALDLAPLVERVVNVCRTTFDRKIFIGATVQENLPLVVGDAIQLEQVFLNLCINARDALDTAARSDFLPAIELRVDSFGSGAQTPLVHAGAAASYIRISVKDNGVGMDEETRRRAFEPFFTTKEPGQGTGLGLSTAYAIVQQHGGWIEVDSQVGRGTVFAIYLPASEQRGGHPAAARAAGVPRGTETLLIIEDEEPIRRAFKAVLERHGYAVLEGADGREGLELFHRDRSRIDLIILDLSLPQLTGKEVLGQLRAIAPRTKVIICTGHLADRTEPLTDQAVLYKPCKAEHLLEAVRRALDT